MTTFSNATNRKHKERLYELFSQIGSALANPHRLEILDLLSQAPRTVDELAKQAQMSTANASQHLQRLKQARLVTDERDGQFIRYSLADPFVVQLWLELRALAQRQLAEVDIALERYRPQRSKFEQISVEELREGLNRNEVVLIDARPEVEFQAGHLSEAISMPLDTLSTRVAEIPPGKTVVAYCRGPYCVYADEALILLSAHGFPVKRLEEGVVEWQQAGYRLEKAELEV